MDKENLKIISLCDIINTLKKIEYNGNNQAINIACGEYEIPTFKKIITRLFRRFKKTIKINE